MLAYLELNINQKNNYLTSKYRQNIEIHQQNLFRFMSKWIKLKG